MLARSQLGSNLAVRLLRTGGRIPGWFPLVVERAHRLLDLPGEVEDAVGGCRIRLDLGEYTQRRIFYRCHEQAELAFVRALLRPGDTFVDVGAHVGLFTLVAAHRVGPAGRVHALEPVPANFERLRRNVEANGLEQVTLTRAAAGDSEATVTLGLPTPELVDVTSGGFTLGGAYGSVTAPCITLDGYLGQHYDLVRLVKIDAEGTEPHVLRGMESTLAEAPPAGLLLEYNADSVAAHGLGSRDLVDPLRGAGYELYRFGRGGRLMPLDSLPDGHAHRPPGALGAVRAGLAQRRGLVNVVALQPDAAGELPPAARARSRARFQRRMRP